MSPTDLKKLAKLLRQDAKKPGPVDYSYDAAAALRACADVVAAAESFRHRQGKYEWLCKTLDILKATKP